MTDYNASADISQKGFLPFIAGLAYSTGVPVWMFLTAAYFCSRFGKNSRMGNNWTGCKHDGEYIMIRSIPAAFAEFARQIKLRPDFGTVSCMAAWCEVSEKEITEFRSANNI